MKYTVLKSQTGRVVLVDSKEFEEEGVEPSDYFVGSPPTKVMGEVDINSDTPSILNMLPTCFEEA